MIIVIDSIKYSQRTNEVHFHLQDFVTDAASKARFVCNKVWKTVVNALIPKVLCEPNNLNPLY